MKKTALIFAMVVCMTSLYPSDYCAYATEILPGAQSSSYSALVSAQKNSPPLSFYKQRCDTKEVKSPPSRAYSLLSFYPAFSLEFNPVFFSAMDLLSTENIILIPVEIFHMRE